MNSVSLNLSHDNSDVEQDPKDWPAWTDEWSYVPSLPFDEDLDQVDESAAIESAAMDLIERSLVPADAVDRLLHFGSDQRYCICTRCERDRRERFLD